MRTQVSLFVDLGVARLLLASEDGRNRIGDETLTELLAAAEQAASRDDVRVVVVTSAAEHFSQGWDEELLQQVAAGGEVRPDPFGCLAALPQPVIAMINGDAVSAGLELALACDLRYCSTAAQFALPETALGLLPLAGGTQRLPRLIGAARATSMLLLGEVVDGRTAEAWGLVGAALPRAELSAEVERIAAVIAGRGPIAERFAKEALTDGLELPLARALRYELDLTVLLQTTADRAEGVRAFVEKRPPRFTGQ